MAARAGARRTPRLGWRFWTFVGAMLALTGVFVVLGTWQLQRLIEKDQLVAAVSERLNEPPVPLPPPREWTPEDGETYDFRPVRVTGQYVPQHSIVVFTNLSPARGAHSGPGYWVMTPLVVEGGGTLFINRGFVPERLGGNYAADPTAPAGEVSLSGIARQPERAGSFTPGPDPVKRLDYVRDPRRLAAMLPPDMAGVAELYLDLPAGAPGALPQGGETIVAFPNNHLGYALTWFGFALLTPLLLAAWAMRQLAEAGQTTGARRSSASQ